ncbi:CU044_5270 family protein [Streptomyces sp. CAU 1734]|uniref:CU044_5270 family protein n=1 Tax=Streptomyces sp. CAU 1734 TaxID=3140360 RepID=UPI003261CA76
MSSAFREQPGRRNTTSSSASGTEAEERAALSAEFAPPPYPEPEPLRTRRRKEHLLREIDRAAAAGERRPARRSRFAMVLVAAVAAGSVGVGANVLLESEPGGQAPAAATRESVDLLERAALAAYERPRTEVLDRQYAYVKTVGRSATLTEKPDGGMRLGSQDESMEQWTAVDGSGQTLRRRDGAPDELIGAPGAKASLNSPTYNLLAELPTDPDALLKRIQADAELNHGAGSDSTTGPDQQAFVAIGDLLRHSVAPPEVSAALHRAAARIPGVTLVPDAVDAVGRKGVAVARVHHNERYEWIFDRSSLRLLGERTVALKDSAWGKAGATVSTIALIDSGIVAKRGELPKR